MVFSKMRKSLVEGVKDAMYRLGKYSFWISTLINIVVGFWFLYSHEAKIFNLLMGKDLIGTVLLWFAVVFALIALVAINKISDSLLVLFVLLIIGFMAVVRRVVENGYFEKHINIYALKADPYWGIFILFAIFFVVLLITLYYGFSKVYVDIKGNVKK